jgi:hypothetical protein
MLDLRIYDWLNPLFTGTESGDVFLMYGSSRSRTSRATSKL